MKFTCTQENFSRGLNVVSHIANRNATLPILNNVLIKVVGGIISLSTTNLEIGISTKIRGKIEKEGEFTVQAKLLADYLNLLPKENIEVYLEDQTLHLACGTYTTSIKGVSSADFPVIPEIDNSQEIGVKADDLKGALSQVMFAVAVDESRPEISGVYFSFNSSNLIMVGTDSYRLAEKKLPIVNHKNFSGEIIIPLRTLQEVYRILSDGADDKVSIHLNDNQILFKINDEVELISRLVEGQYPDYKQIIPTETKTQAKVKVFDLVKVIKSAALFCKPGINDVKLSFLSSKGEIVVSAINNAVGENLVTVGAECTGQDTDMVFNYRYLLEGLNNLLSDEVVLGLISDSAPGVVRPSGKQDYLYIVMPIRQ